MSETLSETLVSVIVPSYNHAPYVAHTIASILDQSYTDLELIIIDDGSRDNSVEVLQRELREKNDPRARLIARENRGLCQTLNEGLALARGKYFAYLGSDDLWESTKLEKQLAALAAEPQAGAAYSDCYIIDVSGKRIGRFGRMYNYRGGRIFYDLLFRRFTPNSPTNLFLSQKLRDVGGFNESLRIEDLNTWVRLAHTYSVVYVPEPLAFYRIHQTNTSTANPDQMIASVQETLEWALKADETLQPLRRRLFSRAQAEHAARFYSALDFKRCRREAITALRFDPVNLHALRILVSSFLGPGVVTRLRDWRRKRRDKSESSERVVRKSL